MQKNSKNRKNRRVLLFLMLLVSTGAMLSTATYAWFTANKNVSINTINVQVEAQNGIQISTNGTTWKAAINNADILAGYSGSVNQLPLTLEPVSTAGNIDEDGHLEMFYGDVKTSGDLFYLTATKETDQAETVTDLGEEGYRAKGKYLAFDVFFKVNVDTPVYLTTSSGVTSNNLNSADAPIKNATRVGFVTLGNTTDGDTLANIQALNAGTNSDLVIWEPNYNVHTNSAINHAKDTYGLTITADNAKLAYDGVKAVIEEDDEILVGDANADEYADFFGSVTTQIATKEGTGFDTYQELFTLNKGITKVRLYVWVEGQDVDCENNASGGALNFNLQVSTNSAAE